MKNIKPSMKVFCAALLICMTFFAGIPTFAENRAMSTQGEEAVFKLGSVSHGKHLEEAVIKLMEEGKLSKDRAEKIIEYKRKREAEFAKDNGKGELQRKNGSLLRELIQQDIITEAEAKAIREKLREMKDMRFADDLQGLVDRGVLTAKDIDNIRNYMLKDREERKERMEKLKSMTPEERKAFFKENKSERKDIITRMVEDKIISEEQAKEMRKVMPEPKKIKERKPDNPALQ